MIGAPDRKSSFKCDRFGFLNQTMDELKIHPKSKLNFKEKIISYYLAGLW